MIELPKHAKDLVEYFCINLAAMSAEQRIKCMEEVFTSFCPRCGLVPASCNCGFREELARAKQPDPNRRG